MFDVEQRGVPSSPPKLVRATPETSPQSNQEDEKVKRALVDSIGRGIMAYEPRHLRGSRSSRRSRRSRLIRAGLMMGTKATNTTEYSTDDSNSEAKNQDFESEKGKHQVKNPIWSPKRFIRRRNPRDQDHQIHDQPIPENLEEINEFNKEKTGHAVDIVGSDVILPASSDSPTELVSNETEIEAQFTDEPAEKKTRNAEESLDDVGIDGSFSVSTQMIPDKTDGSEVQAQSVLTEEQPRINGQDIISSEDEKTTTHEFLTDSGPKETVSESQGQASKRKSSRETYLKEDGDDTASSIGTKCTPKCDGQSPSTSAEGKPYKWIKIGTEINDFNKEKTGHAVDIVGSDVILPASSDSPTELVSNETEIEAQFTDEPAEKKTRNAEEFFDDVDIDGSFSVSTQMIPDKTDGSEVQAQSVLTEEQPRINGQDIISSEDEKTTTHEFLTDSGPKETVSESQGQASKRKSSRETYLKDDGDDTASSIGTKCTPKCDGQSPSTSSEGKPYKWIKIGTEINDFNKEKTGHAVDIVGSDVILPASSDSPTELVSNETEIEAQFTDEPAEKKTRNAEESLDDVGIDGSFSVSTQMIPDKTDGSEVQAQSVLTEEQPRINGQDIISSEDEKTTTHEFLTDSGPKETVSESQGQASKRKSSRETYLKEDGDDTVSSIGTKCTVKCDGQSPSTSAEGKPYKWIKVGTVHWVKKGAEEVFDAKCKAARATVNETPSKFCESRCLIHQKHSFALDIPEVTDTDDIDAKNNGDFESTEVSKAELERPEVTRCEGETLEGSLSKSVTFLPEVSTVEFIVDCDEFYSKEHEEEREADNKDEQTPASLCFGGWSEDSNESETTVRSVTVIDMTDGSLWDSPISRFDNNTYSLREHLTRTHSDHLNLPLTPNPKNSNENVTPSGPLSRGSLSLVERPQNNKEGSVNSPAKHSFDHPSQSDSIDDPKAEEDDYKEKDKEDDSRSELKCSIISRRGRMWAKIADCLRAVFAFAFFTLIVTRTPLCENNAKVLLGTNLAGALVVCFFASLSAGGYHERIGPTVLCSIIYSRKTALLLIYLWTWSLLINAATKPFVEKTKHEIGEIGSESYSRDMILDAIVKPKSQYLSEDMDEIIVEEEIGQESALSGIVERHSEENVLSSYETSSVDRDEVRVGGKDHVTATELLDTERIRDEADLIQDMKIDPLGSDEIFTGDTADDKNGKSTLARGDCKAKYGPLVSDTRPKATDVVGDETASFIQVKTSEQESNVVTITKEDTLRESVFGEPLSSIVETDEMIPNEDNVRQGFAQVKTSEQESDVVVTAEEDSLRESLFGEPVSSILDRDELMPNEDNMRHGFPHVKTSEQESDGVAAAEEDTLKELVFGGAVSQIIEIDEVIPNEDNVRHGIIDANNVETTSSKSRAAGGASSGSLDNMVEASSQSPSISGIVDELYLNSEMPRVSLVGQTQSTFDIGNGGRIVAEDKESTLAELDPKSLESNEQIVVEGAAMFDDTDSSDVVVEEEEDKNGQEFEECASSNDIFEGPAPVIQTTEAVLFTEVDKRDTIEIEEEEERDIPASQSEIESIPATAQQAANSLKPGELSLRRPKPIISLPFVKRLIIVEPMKEWQPLYEIPDLTITEHPTVWARRRDPRALGKVRNLINGALLHAVSFWLGANGKYKNREMIDALSEVWISKLWI